MPTITEVADANALKEEGNKFFKEGKIAEALDAYTRALGVIDIKDGEKAVILKNRAACYLKEEDYQAVINDCTAALEVTPSDPKALYRRCQAYEQLGKVEEAYKDAAALIKADPKNTAVQPILKRLNPIIQEKVKQQNSTSAKVKQMFELVTNSKTDKEQRLQACNNLIVLAREEAGAKSICELSGVDNLLKLLQEKDVEFNQAAIRCLSCLTMDSQERSYLVQEKMGLQKMLAFMSVKDEGLCTSTALLVQNLITNISGLPEYRKLLQHYQDERKQGNPCRYPKFEMDERQTEFIDSVFKGLVKMLQSNKVSGFGRDSAMELIIKNMLRTDGVQWTRKFLDTDGIEGLLTIASAIPQHETCTIEITENSKYHASVALAKIYDDLGSDKERDMFRDQCSAFFKDLFGDSLFESKVEAIKCISSLLQGPYEVGNIILGFDGVTQIMLTLANSDNPMHQQVAVEAIVHSASKKDKCAGLLNDAVPVLKKLYQESTDAVKVRALVGLCKLGSFGGSDASHRPMQDGSTLALAKACRKFLNDPNKSIDLRRWGTEGLAYLTLDAEVKEELINDTAALKSLIDVVAKADKNILYPAASVFVNLTNSYEKPDIQPEMIELAKYSKQHVPEEHQKDKPEFVKQRVHKLAKAGVVSALVAIASTDSPNTREQISRVYNAITVEEDLRGIVVQQGGAKSLVDLATKNNTDAGKILASWSLARITITANPETTFPGQRIYEVVRPLISLLHPDRMALQNFEALMALTNLTSLNDSLRKRIVAENGLPAIEHYMTEDHEMLKRAATECMCNMVMNEEVVKIYEGESDRLKLMVLYCGDEDELVVRAAAGALAMLSHSEKICKKIMEVGPWQEILLSTLVSEKVEIQHRGCYVVRNILSVSKEVAEKVIEGQMLEVLMALSILEDPQKEVVKKCAASCLDICVEHGLIKPKE
ncbi:protein unc-45 homolog B-like [Saccostrea echinata]|uniref:protein unc-45 homolog B-like n=1 Tax=Saccostrea echinata TaxID=191078 RepID=UPI002A7F63D6|nr:protein unc-45 homolog B-like [Saccostrea echinata]